MIFEATISLLENMKNLLRVLYILRPQFRREHHIESPRLLNRISSTISTTSLLLRNIFLQHILQYHIHTSETFQHHIKLQRSSYVGQAQPSQPALV